MKKQILVMVGIAVVVIAGAVLLFMKGNGVAPIDAGKPVDAKKLLRETSHATGKLDAKVVVVEFGDYQCPACAAADPMINQMIADYKDNPDFSFVFRNFPLATHPNAQIAAQAAEAAAEQGKFTEMKTLLYEKQPEWSNSPNPLDMFVNYAQTLGLDTGKFKDAVQGQKFSSVIKADMDDANELGVDSTPTFFVNGEKFNFSTSYQELRTKVDELLKQ